MIAFVFGLARVLMILLVVRFLLRGLAAFLRAVNAPAAPSGTEMVRDPVCNTWVARESALRGRLSGREAWFCSPACAAKGRELQTAS